MWSLAGCYPCNGPTNCAVEVSSRLPSTLRPSSLRANAATLEAWLGAPMCRYDSRTVGGVLDQRFDDAGCVDGSESEAWRPRDAPDPVMLSRQARMRRGSTVVRLYTLSNRVSGTVIAWGALAFAVFLLGKDSLTWSDPYNKGELAAGLVLALLVSVGSYVCLGRPYVDLDAGVAIVRNPWRVTRVPLRSVVRVDRNFWGHVRLHTSNGRVVLWGTEQPLRQAMIGYTEDVRVLLAEIAASGGASELGDGPVRSALAVRYAAKSAGLVAAERGLGDTTPVGESHWQPMDRGLSLLLLGWAVHLTMTLPALTSGV